MATKHGFRVAGRAPCDLDLDEHFVPFNWELVIDISHGVSNPANIRFRELHAVDDSEERISEAVSDLRRQLFAMLSSHLVALDSSDIEAVVTEAAMIEPSSTVVVMLAGPTCAGCFAATHVMNELVKRTGRIVYRADSKSEGVSDWMRDRIAEVPNDLFEKYMGEDEQSKELWRARGAKLEIWGWPLIAIFQEAKIVDLYPLGDPLTRTPSSYETWIAAHAGPWWEASFFQLSSTRGPAASISEPGLDQAKTMCVGGVCEVQAK